MNIITPKNLSGFMELVPKEQVLFEKIKQKLEETYRLYGFYPIDTPILGAAKFACQDRRRYREADLPFQQRAIRIWRCGLT